MGYSANNAVAAQENKMQNKGMKWDRSCTDVICCLVFTAFIFGMIVVSAIAFSEGDPIKIFTPFDSDGNRCGLPDQTLSNTTGNVMRDFTEYKYKYFTGLESVVEGAEALKNPSFFNAVCVKECPSGVSKAKMLSADKQDCMVNDDVTVCPGYNSIFINTTMTYGYCFPETDNAQAAIKEFYKQMNESIGFAQYINSIKEAWQVLVIMAAVTLIITFIYIWLLKAITKPLLYTSLLLILGLGVGTGFYAYQNVIAIEDKNSSDYKTALAGAIIIWIIVLLYCLFICCFWKSIRLGASIMEAASEFITENKRIMFLPIIAYICCLPVILWWTMGSIWIYSMGTPYYDEYSLFANIKGTDQTDGMFIFFLFGLFWIIAFIIAIQIFATSATACMWYFTGHGSDDKEMQGTYSVGLAVKWAFRYHLGSLAVGSFLLAVVTMIRVIFEYMIYQYEKSGAASKENAIYKCVKCCIRGVLKCLDCCVKFINKNAYIQIALHSSNFCKGAKEAFYLNVRNGGRFSAVSMIGGILAILGKGTIVAVCTFLTVAIIDAQFPQITQPYLAALIIAFFAYLISSMFLSIFQDSGLTILHCFCLDEEQGGSRQSPESLKPFLEFSEKEETKVEKLSGSEPGKANQME